ncbi:pyridoxamine 5'-phosphate oxidase family protein [Flammeovirga aprica]|uniref:Pyridoxamine 5'-phosphate oxidase N-terminal domain-containing protein n=1 Tax=Flammeovirga aprica JL-4 TaxID=694437 RepID=A0A7X9XCE4_9BACT|nr:pyridoxamine 5'-phosphate oxidase family protein [Flammeovirga aprica]NME71650.1 hypothetical protein [Flammeovirga aprica JL-4]
MELFHEKERYLQEILGSNINHKVAEKIITNQIDERASRFIQSLNYAFMSYRDKNGFPQVLPLSGDDMIRVPSPSIILINLEPQSQMIENFDVDIKAIHKVGLLFIDLLSRRRLRVNGIVKQHNAVLEMEVEQAYVNCPKYIQSRTLEFHFTNSKKILRGDALTADQTTLIENADTFFLGTSNANGDMDASHRGGNKGFVKVDNNVLLVPDYKGNGLYNSLGNILDYSKVGLLFFDFENAEMLQVKGKATLIFNEDKSKVTHWELSVEDWVHYYEMLEMQSLFFDSSVYNY